jgi:predicted membrane protein
MFIKKRGEAMKKVSSILWGIALVALGVIFALNALNITDFDVFFDGWWTVFIIVPCFIGLFTERDKVGNLIGIAVGVVLLLCCQGVLDFSMLWKLFIPVIIIIIGVKMVISGIFGNKANEILKKMKSEGKELQSASATFSSNNLNYDNMVFEGVELSAVFGGVKCDLRNAIIEKDCAIQATAIFGGIDIFVSDNVNVKVSSNSIFGGISNKKTAQKDVPTIYVSGTCMFGGVEIK